MELRLYRDGKHFVMQADEILTAFVELDAAIRARERSQHQASNLSGSAE